MTPHELINLPGAGKAAKQLAKQGDWDDYAGLPYLDYWVEVEYKHAETDTTYIAVKARSEDEAGIIAYEKNEKDLDVLSGSTKIVEVKETP